VIISSGSDEQSVSSQLEGLGALTLLQKPYPMSDLSDKLQALLSPAD
jgi:hypothetical protein